MAGGSSSTGSGSNQARIASSTTSGAKKRVSLTRVRRDASVELDDSSSVSEYSESSSSDSEDHEEERPAVPKQKRARSRSDSLEQAPSRPGKYTSLRPETRQVEAAIIKSKWRPTTVAAQAKVKTVLSLAERPVININREPERRKEAQGSLAAVSRIIESRLPRMPFPPDTKEWHFDYEAILRNNQDLERQLAATKHSSALIQAEIEKEQRLLEEAEAELEDLEKDTRAQEKARVQRERNTPQMWTASKDPKLDDASSIGLQDSVAKRIDSINSQGDMFSFVEELHGHLDGIQSNIDQVTGLSEGLDRVTGPLALLAENAGT